MLDKIFKEMKKIGWHLEDFEEVLDYHLEDLNRRYYDKLGEEEDYEFDLLAFIIDFIESAKNISTLKYGAKSEKDVEVFEQMLELMEFEVYDKNGILKLKDLQDGGNLGDIEFNDMYEIIDRMEIHIQDYLIRPLSDRFRYDFDELSYSEIEELLKEIKDDLEYDIDMFGMLKGVE